jgi:uncharacterized membrane protein YgaE (UPF0421/DUF939 family)
MKFDISIFPLRIIKTVLAFFISLILAPIFQCDSFFAGIGSLKSMKQSLSLSIYALFEQLASTFIAFIFAIVSSFLFGINPYSVTIALLLLFLAIKQIDSIDTYLTSAFTLLAIMLLSNDQTELINNSFIRFYSLFFGMSIALIINATLFKPKKIDDINQILIKLNHFVHIYMQHDLDEVAYIEVKNTLEELDHEKEIAEEELKIRFISAERRLKLQQKLGEINIANAQTDVMFELQNLDEEFREQVIPIIIKLNGIKQYLNDRDELINIKRELKSLYADYTNNDNFFKNTQFLSTLNIYLEYIYAEILAEY